MVVPRPGVKVIAIEIVLDLANRQASKRDAAQSRDEVTPATKIGSTACKRGGSVL
jgi:hypothetical protein